MNTQTSLGNNRLRSQMGFLIADILGYFNCASPRSTFNHVSLFFRAIHRTLPLSSIFRKFCNKFYPVFHICIYSGLLKSLSLWVTNRKEEGKRLGILSSKPVGFFFFLKHETIYFSFAWLVWNTSNRPKFNILLTFFFFIYFLKPIA